MASRGLRILRRPLPSSICRSLALVTRSQPSSLALSQPAYASTCVVDQRVSLWVPSDSWPFSLRYFASVPGETSGVIEVSNSNQYSSLLKEAKENKKLAVVYFTAKWCGPCRHISPVVSSLSEEFQDVKFFKVDLDEPELQMTVDAAGITAVPTFQFHLEGKMVAAFSGADSKRLKVKVEELLEEAKA